MIDVYEILQKLESMGFLRLHKQVGNYMQIYCPFHNDGNERKPSCGVLLHEEVRAGKKYPQGLFHCFTCHYAKSLPDAVSDLLKLHNISKSGMDWLIENIPGFEGNLDDLDSLISTEIIDTLNEQYAVSYIQSISKPKPQYVTEEELASYRFTVPYMYERKLTDDLIIKFDIGFDANWIPPGRKNIMPCITFPVRDINGNTLFLCRRSIEGKFYNYPKDVVKPLWGIGDLPKNCKSIIICESIINALTCWKYGFPAVALMGTGNAYQIQQLKELGVQEYVICMDGDDAGNQATEKLKKALRQVAIVWTINMLDGKDVNDLDKATFLSLYEDRE